MRTPSRRLVMPTILVLFLFLTTGFAIPTFTDTIFPLLSAELDASAAWIGGVSAPALEATITTNRDDYSPGQIVQISGTGWAPNEQVKLQVDYKSVDVAYRSAVVDVPHGHDPWFVNADSEGNVSSQWLVEEDSRGRTLLLTADGVESGLHAEKTFYDAASIDLEQCHNWNSGSSTFLNCDDPYPAGQTDWGSGNAQSSNARLSEGDNQNFRAIMTDVPVGTHTLVLEFDLTQGGDVAYDRFSSPGRIKTAVSPSGQIKAGPGVTPESRGVFPCANDADPNFYCTAGSGVPFLIPNYTATLVPTPANDPNFRSDVNASQAGDPGHFFLYGDGSLTAVSSGYSFQGSNTRSGNTSIRLSMQITKATSTGRLVLAWGGHVSKLDDYTASGHGTATNITGSPYHMRLVSFSALQGNPGNQDMQMSTTALVAPTGTISIAKQTFGGFGTFPFTAAPSPLPSQIPANFNITTSAPTNPNSTSFANVPSGTYTFTEGNVPNWDLTSISCQVSGGGGSTTSANVPGKSVTIQLFGTDSVSCVFGNALQQGRIEIEKQTLPDGSTQSFGFTGEIVTSLTDGQNAGKDVTPGTYTVSETGLTGWDLTSIVCNDSDSTGSANTATFHVAPGETVRCVFNNRQEGRIEIEKQTLPNGSTQAFGFTGEIVTSLTDGQTSGKDVDPGTYSVSETGLTGWDLSSISCNDSDSTGTSNTATFHVAPGETVRCTFNNTQRSSVVINKTAVGGNDTFGYTGTGTGITTPFNITTAGGSGSQSFTNIASGAKTVTEGAPPAGWDFTSLTCTDPDNGTNVVGQTANIDLDPGETVTCTYTNTRRASVQLVKVANLGDATFTFDTSGTLNGQGSPAVPDPVSITTSGGGGSSATWVFSNLPSAGSSLGFTENAIPDWVLNGASCTGGDSDNTNPASMNVEPGETIVCTFTNTKLVADIAIAKSPSVSNVCTNANSPVTYTYTVTNPGTAPLTVSAIVDNNGTPGNTADDFSPTFVSGDTNNNGILDLTETWTYTATRTISATTTNIVAVVGTSAGGQQDTATATATVTGRVCTVSLTKTPSATQVCNGASVTYTYTVTNNSDFFSASGTIVDDILGSVGPFGPLAPGASATLTKSGVITGTVTNIGTATATFSDGSQTTRTATATATVTGNTCRIRVVKETNPANTPGSFSFTGNLAGSIGHGGVIVADVLQPGSYSTTEGTLDGWQLTNISCDDTNSTGNVGTRTASYNVALGETVTCTFTNTKLPRLRVIKIVQTPEPNIDSSDFTMHVNSPNGNPTPAQFPGSVAGTVSVFDADGGSYNVTEDIPQGAGPYLTSYSTDCTGTLLPGDDKTCTVTNIYVTGFVTSSSLCTFDVSSDLPGSQFRLLYTPDMNAGANIYKMNSSNPGQYYYNVLHYNDPNVTTDDSVTMNIPFPFVTHGATPVHVYSSVTINQKDGQACLVPGTGVSNQQDQIVLTDYPNPVMGVTTRSVTVNVPEGFSYVNIHLDYGLKQTTGYQRQNVGNLANAIQTLTPGPYSPNILDQQTYTFSNGGTHVVMSLNSFKKNPGVGGLITDNLGDPIPGQTVLLLNLLNGQVALPGTTDADGWYFISYKHTGRAADYKVVWTDPTPDVTKIVQLKSNSMAQVDFQQP